MNEQAAATPIFRFRIARIGKPQMIVFVEASSKDEAEQKIRKQYGEVMNGREYDADLDGSLDGKEIIR